MSSSKKRIDPSIVCDAISSIERPPTFTASASGFSRRPLHSGQGSEDMYASSSARCSGFSVSR